MQGGIFALMHHISSQGKHAYSYSKMAFVTMHLFMQTHHTIVREIL